MHIGFINLFSVGGGGVNQELEINIFTLLYIK